MKTLTFKPVARFAALAIIALTMNSCQKNLESTPVASVQQEREEAATANAPTPAKPNFNLEVILRGAENAFGHVKFRQANDIDKIVNLDVWVRDLQPNHEYKLQRAVDTNLDGNCTSTTWLTLGQGLVPQSIYTDVKGTGTASLFRSLAVFASGATFDIHFQVIDAATSAVVLSSDCYQFTIR